MIQTTKNRQGNDRGTSYRSAIFYNDEQQKQVALETIEDVNASGLWPGKVVTEVEPAVISGRLKRSIRNYLVRTQEATPAISRENSGSCQAILS